MTSIGQFKNKSMTTSKSLIKSGDGSIYAVLQCEKRAKICITVNFDALAYPDFIQALERLERLTLLRVTHSDGYSFIALILTQKESDNTEEILSNFIENFPIMLSDHVENKQPVNRVHHGTAGNN
jgi:hypothetical protein